MGVAQLNTWLTVQCFFLSSSIIKSLYVFDKRLNLLYFAGVILQLCGRGWALMFVLNKCSLKNWDNFEPQ